jgi:hypothetical protein
MLALQNGTVDGLIQDIAWTGLEGTMYREMLELSSPVNNFHNLRQKQKESLSIVPFFGLYLSDLVLAESQVKSRKDGLDWSGYRRVGELMRHFQDIYHCQQRHSV